MTYLPEQVNYLKINSDSINNHILYKIFCIFKLYISPTISTVLIFRNLISKFRIARIIRIVVQSIVKDQIFKTVFMSSRAPGTYVSGKWLVSLSFQIKATAWRTLLKKSLWRLVTLWPSLLFRYLHGPQAARRHRQGFCRLSRCPYNSTL